MKTLSVPVAVGSVCLFFAATALAQNRVFTSQYSFGDSLSDSGNLYAFTNRAQPPSPPYFQGRFSNGQTFVELLGQPIVPSVTVSARGPNRNFAFGGAQASGGQIPSLAQQIAFYSAQGLAATPNDLFTVLIGANDMIGVLSAPTTPFNPAAIDAAGAATARTVATGIQSLIGLGAKNIVVAGMPNLGATPRSLAAGGPGGPGATFGLRATTAYNRELLTQLGALASAAPDVNLVYVDLHAFIDHVVRDPAAFGFSNATSFALAPAAQGGGGDPSGYVFFDDIHPTAKTHALLASFVTEMLNPESTVGLGAAIGSAALVLQGIGTSALDARTALLAASNRGARRGDGYVEFNYADGNRDQDGWRPEFDFTGKVITAGVDYRLSDGIFLGGAVDAGRLCATVDGGGRFNVENGTGRVYGVWRGGPVSLVIDGAFGAVSVKRIRRGSALAGVFSASKVSGDHWGAGLKVAWSLDTGRIGLRPWAGLRTGRINLDAYTEREVEPLALSFERQNVRSSSVAAGLDFSSNSMLGSRQARFDLRAAWHGEIGSRDRTVAGRLANNFTVPTVLRIEDGDGSGIELGAACTVWLSPRWSTTVGYAGDIRSGDDLTSRVTLALQTGF